MEQTFSLTAFIGMSQPFSFFHKIFFKTGTSAADKYGPFIYGRFIAIPKNKKNTTITGDGYLFKIDAPRINGNNTSLSSEQKTSLFYKGVLFYDIDVAATYCPE